MTEPKHIIRSRAEKWRFECPAGHNDWRVWNGVFACNTCQKHRAAGEDVDPVFEELRDRKTGERVSRDQVRMPLREGARIVGD